MSQIADSLYFKSPVFVQNLAVSLYGAKLKRQRNGPEYRRQLDELMLTQGYSIDEMEEFLQKRWSDILLHAFSTVPYFRGWAKESGAHWSDFAGRDGLKKLPVLEKVDVKSQAEKFRSRAPHLAQSQFKLFTSGTTGSPMTVYSDNNSRRRHYAFMGRLRRWFDCDDGDWRATFYGRPICRSDASEPPYWRVDRPQKNILFSSYHISDTSAVSYIDYLNKVRPEIILGYPSSLYSLSGFAKDIGAEIYSPNLIVVTAESFFPYQREVIESVFGCPVINQYGNTEMSHFVSQCEAGALHVHPEHGFLEIVDDDGASLTDGEEGRIIATGLINYSMPLLRYDTGDSGALSSRECDCRRPFPILESMGGRKDDVIITPDGRRIGRLDPVFKGEFGIRAAQIIQETLHKVIVNTITDETFTEQKGDLLLAELGKRLSPDMEIVMKQVEEIPRTKGGKFRAVISRLGDSDK